jgi:hypothetical protein
MNHAEFVNRLVDDGIASVRSDSRLTRKPRRLAGAVDGFEACRGKSPEELLVLLGQANRDADAHHGARDVESYWAARYYTLQVEFVCNCVSAAMLNQGLRPIIAPTARGMMQAAKILGVRR